MVKKHKPTIALQALVVEELQIEQLVPNEYNPNRQSEHEFELLKRSITEDGFTQPVIVLKAILNPDEVAAGGLSKHRIVDGEHRWRACNALGFKTISVVKVDMDEAQRRVSTLRHNMARGSHDVELTAGVFKDLEKLGVVEWAQDALQLSDIEVQRMLHDMTPLDEYGGNDSLSPSWVYSPQGVLNQAVDGDESNSEAAAMAASLPSHPLERQRALQQAGMVEKDAQLVKRGITLTASQEAVFKEAVGGRSADTVMAMAEAHVDAKKRASRGEWTTLTFVVPTQALLTIEQELDRLRAFAPNHNPSLTPELQRGLALEYMAVLSAQTPDASLKDVE